MAKKIAAFYLQKNIDGLCSWVCLSYSLYNYNLSASLASTLHVYTVKKLKQDVTSNFDIKCQNIMPQHTGVPNTWTAPLGSCQIFLKPIAAAVTPGCSDFWEHWSRSLADTKIIKVNKKQPISYPQTIIHVTDTTTFVWAQFWIKCVIFIKICRNF